MIPFLRTVKWSGKLSQSSAAAWFEEESELPVLRPWIAGILSYGIDSTVRSPVHTEVNAIRSAINRSEARVLFFT